MKSSEDTLEKTALRRMMRERRRQVSPERRAALSAEICERILGRADVHEAVARRRTFAVYLASPEEIDLSTLVAKIWNAGCRVAVPAWRNGGYVLVSYTPESSLVAGPMGILEPTETPDERVLSDEPSVWVVPGLAFSRDGARLGYGGGWYDRFLAAASPEAVTLGVAYCFQIADHLPQESHDITLTGIVSTDCDS